MKCPNETCPNSIPLVIHENDLHVEIYCRDCGYEQKDLIPPDMKRVRKVEKLEPTPRKKKANERR